MITLLKHILGNGPQVYMVSGWQIVAYLRQTNYRATARLGEAMR